MVAKKPSRLKKFIPIAVIVIGAIATLLYMQQKRRPRELVLSGTLEARTVNVGSLVGGRVTSVHVDEGNLVKPMTFRRETNGARIIGTLM